jgi:2-oxoglutarate dehydrogenase E2 component (dihydrolipoamide succinyltransferase)
MAEIKVPELAESITEGTVAGWLKNIGDVVKKGDYIVELETDKVNIELNSEYSGKITELRFSEGDTVKVGDTIAIIDESVQTAVVETNDPLPEPEEPEEPDKNVNDQNHVDDIQKPETSSQRPVASPAARKLAREKGINLNEVPAMDPFGRIRKQDVTSFLQEHTQSQSIYKKDTVSEPQEASRPIIVEQMSRRRQTIAKRLVEVKQTTAMLTTFNEIDMTAVMDLRKRWKEQFFEEHDARLGFMSFFTKAAVAALKKFPYLNAEIQGNELLIKKFYDIGIAVAAEDGLVVPVVRDADRKSFAEIESDIAAFAEKARTNTLALKELQGGTFTITNGGVFGSLLSTPILNGPQVGILGMHKIQLRPTAIDKEKIENRPMMYVALSYDHRIVDGKEAVSFLTKIKELLENPEALLLEG